jgi:pimeloyl-ACP methyl ester carboxylesterase
MDQFARRLVGVGVHRGAVKGADLCRMFNAAIHGRGAPRPLSTGHDPLFEAHRWTANLRIRRGRQVLVPNSGHGIPVEAPEAVISAVREIVTTVRDERH